MEVSLGVGLRRGLGCQHLGLIEVMTRRKSPALDRLRDGANPRALIWPRCRDALSMTSPFPAVWFHGRGIGRGVNSLLTPSTCMPVMV